MCVCACVPIFRQNKQLCLFQPKLPKSGFRVGNSENYCRNKNQHPRYTMCTNFPSKWTTLHFSAQICQKKILGMEIEKSNVGIRSNIVKTLRMPIFSQTGQLWVLLSKFSQKWISVLKFKNLMEQESAYLRYYVHQFLDKSDNFEFLGPNLPINRFWGQNFKNLSLDLESRPPIDHVCQFSVKIDYF